MKHFALICSLLVSATASAQTYSDASVKGNYSLQFGDPYSAQWGKTFTCPSNPTVSFSVNGSQTTTHVTYGTATFGGTGGFSFTVTNSGNVDYTASANTTSVTWNSSCQVVSVNGGYAVYKAPVTQTGTGTYSVASNGTGTLNPPGGSPLTFILAARNSAGISTTVLLTSTVVKGKSIGTGIAVLQ